MEKLFYPSFPVFLFGNFFEHEDTEEHEMAHFVYVISQTDVHSFFSCTVKNIKGVKFVPTSLNVDQTFILMMIFLSVDF